MDELQSLIDLALSDGRISEGEMKQLRSKATILGIDEYRLLQLIDGRKGIIRQDSGASVIRCPNCKEPVQELATRCEWCGCSLTKVMDRESINAFYQRLMVAPPSDRQVLISAYPLPLSKQEIIELLSVAVPSARQMTVDEKESFVIKGSAAAGNAIYDERLKQIEAESRAWSTKARAVIDNASFIYREDGTFIAQLKDYEAELKRNVSRIESAKDKSRREAKREYWLGWLVFIGIGAGLYFSLTLLQYCSRHFR